MTKKKLTKEQKAKMLQNAISIAKGEKDETSDMSYVQAWQHLVDTGEVWELESWMVRAVSRMLSDGTLRPQKTEEEPKPQDTEEEE
jgi:hypothetical protein